MSRIIVSFLCVLVLFPSISKGNPENTAPLYPADIKIVRGSELLIACSGTREVRLTDLKGNLRRKWQFSEPVTGIATDHDRAYVTSSGRTGYISVIDINIPGIIRSAKIGMGSRAPVLSADGNTLYVAAQFETCIYKIRVKDLSVLGKTLVLREPYSMVVSQDGQYLFVNNFLPAGRADAELVTAEVSVISLPDFTRIKDIKLSNGSNALKGICLSPDGNFLFIAHNLGRFQVPTSQLEQGWMNTAGLSVVDARKLQFMATVILDEPERGAASSWDVQCNQEKILVTHSGTHDISLIDYGKFIGKLVAEPNPQDLAYNLHFLEGIRQRYPVGGNGPRSFALFENQAYIPTYFSDILNVFDINSGTTREINLNPDRKESPEAIGERIFNDASYCFQGWQSCNGCHPGEARTDGLNWDLLNDGMGNPKNCKSLLFSHETPPVMISGIRGSAEAAVRAGFKHIQFSSITEEDARFVDAYVKSLEPLPSPWLVNGKLSKAARKGKQIFDREGCADCHSGIYFTNLQSYKMGEEEKVFQDWKGWDTPTLREVWRTGPYLFNGSAGNMKEVFEVYGHGLKHALTKDETAQLAEYINSL
jgi:DNA-binding beta-propeller fold protein YncE